jgi:hypothetical protein
MAVEKWVGVGEPKGKPSSCGLTNAHPSTKLWAGSFKLEGAPAPLSMEVFPDNQALTSFRKLPKLRGWVYSA